MAQASDYAARMVAALAVSEPTLDTGIGSVVRKILDAVSEVAASVTNEQYLLNYTFDVNSKSGADLDDFLLMFGFIRFPARRATGIVTFYRSVAATQDFVIPSGTSVTTGVSPTITYQTTAPAYLTAGTTSVQVPIQCVLAGSAGNAPINAITAIASAVSGINSNPTNTTPIAGGTPPESDAFLRDRWKKTVFRSLAGTADQFTAMALQNNSLAADGTILQSSAVSVFGASSRWKEQVQIIGGSATSSIPAANVKYVFPNSSVVGTDVEDGVIYTPGVHYTFNSTAPPTITVLSGSMNNGDFVDLDFEYCSAASRNDPVNGITNRVDVWVGGQRLLTASETSYFRTTTPFTSTAGPYLASTFLRLDSNNVAPTVGNFFIPLAFGPIITFPAQLSIGGTTYVNGTDYWVVHDNTATGYGPTSAFGIEWLASRALAVNTAIPLTGNNNYVYNALPSDVENQATTQKLVTTDVRAHQAKPVYLRFGLAVMANYGTNRTVLTLAIKNDLTSWLDTKGFSSNLQVSDILQEIHNVAGVDNVRLLTSAEPTTGGVYGVERVTSTGTHLSNFQDVNGRASDIIFADNQVPILSDVLVVYKAANSFGVS
jgi:uncharacterized phage protein gp47/JayE